MKEEINIDGVTYVRKDTLKKKYKKYEEIEFKGLKWIVLEQQGDILKLLLKDVLDKERITRYCVDDWYRTGRYVRHTDRVRPPFNCDKSYINRVILPTFMDDLGVKGEIDLLTKDEVTFLPNEVRKSNYWYWTKTNASDANDSFCFVFYVDECGNVRWHNAFHTYGVRPVICLNSSNLE